MEYIIGTDWHSLSVWESPAMGRLKELVRSRTIHAIFMYDADRGPAKPAHRLLFRAMCEERGVKVRCKYGQVPDGEMGEVMEFLSAWAKEKQVQRAQRGAADGLRDRAAKRGLPVNNKAPYGYQFRFAEHQGKRVPVALGPGVAYPVAVKIWQWAMNGTPIRKICHELASSNVPAPRGGGAWYPGTIHTILTNPAYAGRFCALRSYVREPQKRRKESYGKSTCGKRPASEWVWLEDFPIIDPVVSWGQWEAVQDRLRLNKAESQRKAKRLFILGGMLFCGQCGKRMSGYSVPKQNWYAYRCTGQYGHYIGMKSCRSSYVSGSVVEKLVWECVAAFLQDPEHFMAEMQRRQDSHVGGKADVQTHLEVLTRKLANVDGMDNEVVAIKVRGLINEEVFERSLALNRAERVHLTEEIDRKKAVLATLQDNQAAVETLVALRQQAAERLGGATPEDRRWLLQMLDTRITADENRFTVSLGVPPQPLESVSGSLSCRA
jgi:site-specific DNA recombinase